MWLATAQVGWASMKAVMEDDEEVRWQRRISQFAHVKSPTSPPVVTISLRPFNAIKDCIARASHNAAPCNPTNTDACIIKYNLNNKSQSTQLNNFIEYKKHQSYDSSYLHKEYKGFVSLILTFWTSWGITMKWLFILFVWKSENGWCYPFQLMNQLMKHWVTCIPAFKTESAVYF